MTEWLIIALLTIVSAIGDAFGFVYAAKIWHHGSLIQSAFIKSAIGFFIGISSYWLVVKYLSAKQIVSPELQALYWFSITTIGIALLSGKMFSWPLREKMIGLIAVTCIAWLIYHVE